MGPRITTNRLIGIGLLLPVLGLVLLVSVVGVRTLSPLSSARDHLEELERDLGEAARYVPRPDGAIPAERMEVFLRLRTALVPACEEYAPMARAVGAIDSLETRTGPRWEEVGDVARVLGGAALEITPFVARYFEMRNAALLAARMSLEEYAYIYAVAYREHLLAAHTRTQVFSDGLPLSSSASAMLQGCLRRQLERGAEEPGRLRREVEVMAADPARLPWGDGLPPTIASSVAPYRDELDRGFCPATAGLEMESTADRAIRLALE